MKILINLGQSALTILHDIKNLVIILMVFMNVLLYMTFINNHKKMTDEIETLKNRIELLQYIQKDDSRQHNESLLAHGLRINKLQDSVLVLDKKIEEQKSVPKLIPKSSNTKAYDVTKLQQDFNALVRATWRLETGNGTSELWLKHNNAGGIKNGVNYASYKSKEEGMEALKDLLGIYVSEFGNNIKDIRNKWCQCNLQDLDEFMKIFMEELNK